MKRGIVGLPLLVMGLCVPLRAEGNCDGNLQPPPPIAEKSIGPPEFLDKPGDCAPAIGARRPGGVSVQRLTHKPSSRARKEFRLGSQDWRKGQSGQAVLHLAEAARLDPNYLEAQAQLGVVYVQTGRASEALDCFERALAIEPNSAALNITKAGALLMLGRSQEAEQAARRALQLAPASIEASYILGMALFDQGQTARAVEQLAVAAEKFPHAGEVLRSIQQQR